MSTLGYNIRAYQTNDRFIVRAPLDLPVLSMVQKTAPTLNYLLRYEIKAILGASAVLPDDGQPEQSEIFTSTKKMICAEVFREYRMPLLRALHAIHDYRTEDAIKIIEAIGNNMDDDQPFEMPELSGARR